MITVTGAESSPQDIFTAGVRGIYMFWVVSLTEFGIGTFKRRRGSDPLLTMSSGAAATNAPDTYEREFAAFMQPGDVITYEGVDVQVYGAILGDVLV